MAKKGGFREKIKSIKKEKKNQKKKSVAWASPIRSFKQVL
jgi:hypothetical protein